MLAYKDCIMLAKQSFREGGMKNRILNQRGLTLVELLAATVILALILVPLLTLTISFFTNSLGDGERNQSANVAQAVIEDVKILVKSGDITSTGPYIYDQSESEYPDYDIDVEIEDFPDNDLLKRIYVTVSKESSGFAPVTLKTVVRVP